MVKNAGVDYKSISYWFSVSISLFNAFLNHLNQIDESLDAKTVHESGIYLPERKYVPEGSSNEKTLQFTSFPGTIDEIPQFENDRIEKEFRLLLEILLYEIFDLIQSKIEDEIELKLEDSFISGASSLFTQKLTFNDPKMSIQLVTDVLDRLLKSFLENYIPPSVIYQSFSQLIYFISASLFNKIITNKNYCAPRIAFQIKLGISSFLSWLHKLIPSLPFFKNLMKYFNHITEAVNLITLVTNEKVFESEDLLSSTFPTLNIAQIRKVTELYTPDKTAPEPIPASVKRLVNAICQKTQNLAKLPVDVSVVLPLSEINTADIDIDPDY